MRLAMRLIVSNSAKGITMTLFIAFAAFLSAVIFTLFDVLIQTR